MGSGVDTISSFGTMVCGCCQAFPPSPADGLGVERGHPNVVVQGAGVGSGVDTISSSGKMVCGCCEAFPPSPADDLGVERGHPSAVVQGAGVGSDVDTISSFGKMVCGCCEAFPPSPADDLGVERGHPNVVSQALKSMFGEVTGVGGFGVLGPGLEAVERASPLPATWSDAAEIKDKGVLLRFTSVLESSLVEAPLFATTVEEKCVVGNSEARVEARISVAC